MPVSNVSLTAPTDYAIQAQEIDRRRKLAEALQAQSMQPMETNQMAGGYVLPVSPTAGLAKMMQAYAGAQGQKNATEQQMALAAAMRGDRQQTIQDAMGAMQGSPATAGSPMPPDDQGGGPAQPPQAAVAGDPRKAYGILAGSQDPGLAQLGLAQMLKGQDPFTLKPGETRFGSNAQPIANLPAANSTKYHVVGGNLVPEPAAPAPGTPPGPPPQVAPVYTAPQKPEKDENAKFRDVLTSAGIDPDSPAGKNMFRQLALKQATHQPSAQNNVTIKQEGAEAGAVGKAFGEEFNKVQTAGAQASTTISKLDRMSNLLTGIDTGKLTPAATNVAAIADSLGIKIDKNLPAKQAANALAGEIALGLRNPAGGAGMPGAMSDKDREFLQAMTPNLANTPGGNAMIIETAKKLAKRDQEVAKLAREYRVKTGHMDEGFYTALQQYSDANPLFGATGAPSNGGDRRQAAREPVKRVVLDFSGKPVQQ